MKAICYLIILFFSFSTSLLSQGRGDQIFDESYIHEIRISSELSLSELSNIYYDELFNSERTYTLSEVAIDGNTIDSVGIRVKGGLSAFDQKKPFKLDFNSFVSGQLYDGIKKLNLHQGNMDPSYIREAVTYGLMRDSGIKTVRTSFAKIYYNDIFEGVYTLVEQIDDNFIKNRFASSDGALYKAASGLKLKYEVENPLPYEEFVSAVNLIPTDLLHEQLSEYLDVESFLRFFAVNVFVNAVDGPILGDVNYYIYYEPKSGTYNYIPWDYNLALYAGANYPLFVSSGNFLLNRALSNPILKTRYLDIFCELLQYNFVEDKLMDQISSYQDLLKDDIPNDPYISLIGNWGMGVETVKNVISSRIESLTGELEQNIDTCLPLINPLAPSDVVINEIVASNNTESGINDPNGSAADWVELYNNTSGKISLDGYYLSNDRDVLKHWRIPNNTTIEAFDYLIIWADRDIDEEGLHTSFKLNKNWDELILSHENGDIIDDIIFNNLDTNVALARVPNGTGDFKKQPSTFGYSNSVISSADDESLGLNWKVFPNPVIQNGDLFINSSQNALVEIFIFNIRGKLLWKENIQLKEGSNPIDLSQGRLGHTGIYNIILLDKKNGNKQSQKLTILE